jgi:UDP-GlcNAc:undecaprenyl-phosphate/decaprenyl-phosphate GlcNAc-1-phosphate transferase
LPITPPSGAITDATASITDALGVYHRAVRRYYRRASVYGRRFGAYYRRDSVYYRRASVYYRRDSVYHRRPRRLAPLMSHLVDIIFLSLTFFTALAFSLVFTPASGVVARYLGVIDVPDERKIHALPVPRMGGVAMAAAMLLSILLLVQISPGLKGVLCGLVVIVGTGLLDDKRGISPKLKFAGQILAVLLFMAVSGFHLQHLGNLVGLGDIRFGVMAWPVTVFAMVGLINAFNLSDGLDGLAAGISAIACVFLLPLAYVTQHWYAAALLAVLLGVVLGFLRFNTHPARVFMGDTGSLLLGYTLAVVAVRLAFDGGAGKALMPVTIFTIFSLPIVDTTYVMTRRILQGRSPFRPGKGHLHHRLMRLGLDHGTTVALIYGMCGVTGVAAWLMIGMPEYVQFGVIVAAFVTLYATLYTLERKSLTLSLPWLRPIGTACKTLEGGLPRFWVILPQLVCLALLAPLPLVPKLPSALGLLAFGAVLFVVLLYPWRRSGLRLHLSSALTALSVYFVIALYQLTPGAPEWLNTYLVILSLGCLALVVPLAARPRRILLLPSGFEFLLMLMIWLVPFLCGLAFDLDRQTQYRLFAAFLLALPIQIMAKMAASNCTYGHRRFILGLLAILICFGIKAML